MKDCVFFLALLLTASACTELHPSTTPDDAGNDVSTSSDADAGAPDAPVSDDMQDVRDAQDAQDATAAPADGPDALPIPCVSDCDEEGTARCTDLTHLQKCEAHEGCLRWSDATECAAMQVCCGSLCLLANESSCYACGTKGKCSGLAPVCDHTVKSCVCDEATCQAKGLLCDAVTHACIPDPSSVYVDSVAPGGGDGTHEHPFRSITAALDAHPKISTVMHIHIAAGQYNAEHDERFPLVLRGVSLEGAGIAQTIIAGIGKFDSSASKGIAAEINTTVVIGDTSLASSMSNLTVYEPGVEPIAGHYGIFCDRGNTPVVPNRTVLPNTKLVGLKVGPGYDTGVVVATSSVPTSTMATGSGCNIQITGTNFKIMRAASVANPAKIHQVGVWGIGSESTVTPGSCALGAMIQLGDGIEVDGNRFDGVSFATATNVGVQVDTCVHNFVSSDSYFSYTESGIDLRQPNRGLRASPCPSIITHNTFESQRQFGISAKGGAALIEDLSDNLFQGIRFSQDPHEAFALLVEDARVVKARRNKFKGNQVGVMVRLGANGGSAVDFGTPADPGGNSFLCNSADPDLVNGLIGGDVVLLDHQWAFNDLWSFAGNSWDHSPPHSAATLTVDGTDLTAVSDPIYGPAKVDTSGSTAVDTNCHTP